MEKREIDIVESSQPSEQQVFQSGRQWHHIREKQLLSRLLYPNPVCLLTTTQLLPGYLHHNAMVISWLTPVDNDGNIFLSINAKRHSAARLMTAFSATAAVDKTFVLNVPVASQESMVLRIGGCSGRDGNKFDSTDGEGGPRFTLCRPGWTALATATRTDTAVAGSTSTASAAPGVALAATDTAIARTGCRPDITAPATDPPAEDIDLSLRARRRAKKQRQPRDAGRETAPAGVALRECVAHIVCTLTHMYADDEDGDGSGRGSGSGSCGRGEAGLEDDGHTVGGDRSAPSTAASHRHPRRHRHYRVFARMQQAFVRDGYWDGDHNVLRPTEATLPPLLSFLGSKQFARLT